MIVHSYDGGQDVVATLQGMGSSATGDANSVILQLEVGEAVSVQLEEGWKKDTQHWGTPALHLSLVFCSSSQIPMLNEMLNLHFKGKIKGKIKRCALIAYPQQTWYKFMTGRNHFTN